MIDWSRSPDVESKPGVMSGVFVIKGTRVPPDSILEHWKLGYSAQLIVTELFPTVSLSRAERVIAHALRHQTAPAA